MVPKGKLIAVGGAEDKGTDLETGEIHRSNLNFFELGILRRVVEEAGGPDPARKLCPRDAAGRAGAAEDLGERIPGFHAGRAG